MGAVIEIEGFFAARLTELLRAFHPTCDVVQVNVETKLDTFSSVYKKITNKDVVFEFPVQEP